MFIAGLPHYVIARFRPLCETALVVARIIFWIVLSISVVVLFLFVFSPDPSWISHNVGVFSSLLTELGFWTLDSLSVGLARPAFCLETENKRLAWDRCVGGHYCCYFVSLEQRQTPRGRSIQILVR